MERNGLFLHLAMGGAAGTSTADQWGTSPSQHFQLNILPIDAALKELTLMVTPTSSHLAVTMLLHLAPPKYPS